ncbi:MAG: lipid IV(A) 3-deoxy-D-manno-octulosonic acid transferase [Pseudomonadota bacterium]
MRLFYSLMWTLAMPLVLARLWWRGRKEPGYRQHWGERLGFYSVASKMPASIWVHAVSVGETRAAEPLIDALMVAYPDIRIILTHMTPTGRATGQGLFSKHGARLVQAYLPYDLSFLVARFIRHFAPRVCILMETEVWPNMIAACARHAVPVALVNARLSARSLRRGQRFGALMRDAARNITLVAAQTEADANRIASLGAPRVEVTGSIKFDVLVPDAALQTGAWMRAQIGARPVLLCASTRDGEEALILDAWQALPANELDALLMIVPRHPQRFDDVAKLVGARGLSLARRSQLGTIEAGVQVLLGDSMGEMFAYYAACDCAFIGGSLLPLGGQNLIEACALSKPVLVGPHTFNFAQATEEAIAAGGARCVPDATQLMRVAVELLGAPAVRADIGVRAHLFANRHRGATARTLEMLHPLIVTTDLNICQQSRDV